MRRFLVEYRVPNAGQLSAVEIDAMAQQWCGVLLQLGPDIQMLATYVTEHAMYSLYLAEDTSLIREHAHLTGLRTDLISVVTAVFTPGGTQ